ncbi:MAG: hypothetical protein WC488_05040 [Candidatus Micrarchaeia archaeon]
MDIIKRLDLGPYFTFEPSKSKPIYNWFYYKEAYSPELVEKLALELNLSAPILDPFSGIGTTALFAKSLGMQAYGIDSSQLAVFAGQVKTEDYSEKDLEDARAFLKDVFQHKDSSSRLRWDFELFQVEKVFPPANLRDILFLREKIAGVQNEKAMRLLLLALVSILPMCGFILKDGGVLKIEKKSVAPVREVFKRKTKRMLSDLENAPKGPRPEILLGDARSMPFENESMNSIITSPPYLNNIDYTKVYGLEISLLEMDLSSTRNARGRSVRSFITSDAKAEEIPEEAYEYGCRIPVAGTYFADMEKVLKESFRALKPGGTAVFVVGNSVIRETHIPVDEILAQIGERLGFESEIWIGLERIADVKPAKVKTRESAIVFRKP